MHPEEGIAQVIVDEHQTIVEVDDRFIEMTKRGRYTLIGSKALSFTFGNDLIRNQPMLDGLINSGPSFSITKRYVTGEGAVRWVENHVSGVQTGTGMKLFIATSRAISRPFSTDATSVGYKSVRYLLATILAGRAIFGVDVVSIPAAEALLVLYRAELEGSIVTVGDLSNRTSTPVSTMTRWISILNGRDLVEIEAGMGKNATNVVRISRTGELALEGLFAASQGIARSPTQH